jgi:hypothetical protein
MHTAQASRWMRGTRSERGEGAGKADDRHWRVWLRKDSVRATRAPSGHDFWEGRIGVMEML